MKNSKLLQVVSADGTVIAFERLGSGPPVILIGGAFNDRQSKIAGTGMAELLAVDFTVYSFDRRGRGDTSDVKPWSTDREIEDIAALITEAGNKAFLFGHSSGGALVLEAAADGLSVEKLAIYEPPYTIDEWADGKRRIFREQLEKFVSEDQPEEAVSLWMSETGMPEQMLVQFRNSPFWPTAVRLASTLPHELAIVARAGNSFIPTQRFGRVTVPVLAMAGSASPEWMRHVAESIAKVVGNGMYYEFEGSNHMIPPELVAPVLKQFFVPA